MAEIQVISSLGEKDGITKYGEIILKTNVETRLTAQIEQNQYAVGAYGAVGAVNSLTRNSMITVNDHAILKAFYGDITIQSGGTLNDEVWERDQTWKSCTVTGKSNYDQRWNCLRRKRTKGR